MSQNSRLGTILFAVYNFLTNPEFQSKLLSAQVPLLLVSDHYCYCLVCCPSIHCCVGEIPISMGNQFFHCLNLIFEQLWVVCYFNMIFSFWLTLLPIFYKISILVDSTSNITYTHTYIYIYHIFPSDCFCTDIASATLT